MYRGTVYIRTYKEIVEYVELQNQNKYKVIIAKTEQAFNDLVTGVRVWNVKVYTKNVGGS